MIGRWVEVPGLAFVVSGGARLRPPIGRIHCVIMNGTQKARTVVHDCIDWDPGDDESLVELGTLRDMRLRRLGGVCAGQAIRVT